MSTPSSENNFTRKDLIELFTRYIEFHFNNPNVFKLFLNQKIQSPPQEILHKMTTPEANELIISMITKVAENESKDIDPVIAANLLMNSVFGMLSMHFGSISGIDQASIRAQVVQYILFIFTQ